MKCWLLVICGSNFSPIISIILKGNEPLIQVLWNYFIMLMILYFVMSIVNSLVQGHLVVINFSFFLSQSSVSDLIILISILIPLNVLERKIGLYNVGALQSLSCVAFPIPHPDCSRTKTESTNTAGLLQGKLFHFILIFH